MFLLELPSMITLVALYSKVIPGVILWSYDYRGVCWSMHSDQHHLSLLLHYSSLSYTNPFLLSIARYAGIYRQAAGPYGPW